MTLSLDRSRELRTNAKDSARHAYERGNVDSGRYWDELDSALAAAEALARLEVWLAENRSELVCWKCVADDGFTAMFSARSDGEDGHGPNLLTAVTRALDQAEGKS